MKKLGFLLLFIGCIGCQSADRIQEIEVLTYFTNAKDFRMYTTTSAKGFTQTLSQSETSDKIDNYQTRIRQSLMDSIAEICRSKSAPDFKFKSPKGIVYCGNWRKVRVTFESGRTLAFKFPYANVQNRQFRSFQSLCNQIQDDSLRATRLDLGQLDALYRKQQDLSDETFKQDSIFIKKYLQKR